jgi:hypothetical protein
VAEQRNRYRGPLNRAWLRLDFRAPGGAVHALDLVADTASHYGLILRRSLFDQLVHHSVPPEFNQYGMLVGGWLRLYMPSSGLVELVRGYGNDLLCAAVAEEDPNFMGLVGLPVLRLGEYGGNATDFWFRYPPTSPSTSQP